LNEVNEYASRLQELEGQVSVCDILAYQIGWGKLLIGWEAAEKNGLKPAMPAEGYQWNQLGVLARSFYQTYQNFSLMELKREFEKSVQHILQWIDAMNEEEIWHLNQRHWTGNKWPIGKWIQVNTVAPYTSARRKIRVWKKSKFG
jgi:hypothetical protein